MADLSMTSTGVTFGAKTASVDIPKPRHGGLFVGRDSSAATAADKSAPADAPGQMLPTPPNSISPSLPPQGFRARGQPTTEKPPSPHPVDTDLDLRDAVDDANDRDHAVQSKPGLNLPMRGARPSHPDAYGAITPALLAKYHLPDVLLAHGPLAIRHLMGYLTTSVPGFSRIPPAKARRLVVGALEGRGNGGEGGGINGDVEFEKVGWGRWDARIRGQPAREVPNPAVDSLSGVLFTPPASAPSSHSPYAVKGLSFPSHSRRPGIARSPGSWTDDSIVFSHDEELEFMDQEDDTMLDHEADKMSLDNDGSCSSSEAPEEEGPNVDDDGDMGDVTDEEDWAKIGAVALRQAYLPRKRGGHRYPVIHGPPRERVSTFGRARSARLKPLRAVTDVTEANPGTFHHQATGLVIGSDSQERDAIEALVRLSSV